MPVTQVLRRGTQVLRSVNKDQIVDTIVENQTCPGSCPVVPERRKHEEIGRRRLAEVEPAAVGAGLATSQGLGGVAGLVGSDESRQRLSGRGVGRVVRGRWQR